MSRIPPLGSCFIWIFFNVESIRVFTSTFVAICSDTSYPFGFTSIRKCPPIDILHFFVTKLRNQYKKFALILVYEDGELSRSYEFTNKCHNMNTIIKTTGGDESSLNGKLETPNKILVNIKRDHLLNLSHNK